MIIKKFLSIADLFKTKTFGFYTLFEIIMIDKNKNPMFAIF